ncbi:MAG: major facilitator superfamily domain-containing protein [Benniella sp.]|nr:MAG: major facilitator superfamily domain-containing protein [Benniella sp.]
MDSRTLTTLPQYMLYCALVTSLTSFSIGYVIGAPNIPESSIRGKDGDCGTNPYTVQAGFPNCFEFSDLTWGFAIGSFCLGACVGGLVGGGIQNKYGRLKTMLLSNILFIIGSLILGFTFHQTQFILGRIVIGSACGLGSVVAPTYLGEIATIETRGTLGTFHQLFIVVGLVVSNLVGLVWSTPPGWRITLALNGVPALLQCFFLPTMLETPRYLVSRRSLQEAQRSLQRFRGSEKEVDILPEFKEIVNLLLGEQSGSEKETRNPDQELDLLSTDGSRSASAVAVASIQRGDSLTTAKSDLTTTVAEPPSPPLPPPTTSKINRNQEPYGILELFRSECRDLAVIGILVHFLQQATGINCLVFYSTSFLANVFGSSHSKYITVGTSCCSLVSTVCSLDLIRRFSRKSLMMASFAGICLSSIMLVIGSFYDIGILVAVAVFLFIGTFAFAMGPIPWLLLSELLPTYALSPASSVATGINWGTNFVIGLVFPSMAKGMGSATFILFAVINFLGVLYIWYFVPETKGRTVEAVMAEKGVRPRS